MEDQTMIVGGIVVEKAAAMQPMMMKLKKVGMMVTMRSRSSTEAEKIGVRCWMMTPVSMMVMTLILVRLTTRRMSRRTPFPSMWLTMMRHLLPTPTQGVDSMS